MQTERAPTRTQIRRRSSDVSKVSFAGIDGTALGNCHIGKFAINVVYCCGRLGAAFKGQISGEVERLDSLVMTANMAPVIEEANDEIRFTVTRPHSSGKSTVFGNRGVCGFDREYTNARVG
jgi:hypothetical protein